MAASDPAPTGVPACIADSAEPARDVERLRSEFAVSARLPEGMLARLARGILTFLGAPQKVDLEAQLDKLADPTGLTPDELKELSRALLIVFQGALRHGMRGSQVSADLESLGVDGAAAAAVSELWEGEKGDLASAVVPSTLMVNRVVDMAWSFGVTVATDEVQDVGSTYVRLKLTLDSGAAKHRTVYTELSLPQFYDLMAELERANSFLKLSSLGDDDEEEAASAGAGQR